MKLRNTESVWRDSNTGGFVAEVRGLYDEERDYHEWIQIGIYGTRDAALEAIRSTRD